MKLKKSNLNISIVFLNKNIYGYADSDMNINLLFSRFLIALMFSYV